MKQASKDKYYALIIKLKKKEKKIKIPSFILYIFYSRIFKKTDNVQNFLKIR